MTSRPGDGDLYAFLTSADLLDLGKRAHEERSARHPDPVVTYIHDANPNTTNLCVTGCAFCAFRRREGEPGVYMREPEEIVEHVRPFVEAGIQRILMQGGHNPNLGIDYCERLIRALSDTYPDLDLHLFSAPEIAFLADREGMTDEAVLKHFHDLGLSTLPGGGAEVLSEPVRRKISPAKIPVSRWLAIHRAAHRIGFLSTATLMYGHVETPADIVTHLRAIRDLQDDTGGFIAFIPWSFKSPHTPMHRWTLTSPFRGPLAYPRIIAASRVYLDNFPHIQSSWFSEGKRVGQIGLHFGADDFGGTLLEETVLKEAEHAPKTTEGEVRALIEAAGFRPRRRETVY